MPSRVKISNGQSIYKYTMKSPLGSGGFGDVWLAHDQTIARDIAVKVLAQAGNINERLQEAIIGNHLEHSNLVKMHYADVVNVSGVDVVIIAMDYLANGSILSRLNSRNFMIIPEVIRYMTDILRGMEYLHELNLYHNDIKPNNILIGNADQGVLTDYGITCYSPSGLPVNPKSAYKLHIAPEVITSKQINCQTDVYQVGVTAFRLLNGIGCIQDKFNSMGEDEFNKAVCSGEIIQSNDYLAFIPRNLKTVINKAVHVNPSFRYQSAIEMRRALERLSYRGYWTTNASGNYRGYNDKYEYYFEEKVLSVKLHEFTAYKINKESGRKTKISEYSKKNLTGKQREEIKRSFMQWVVTG